MPTVGRRIVGLVLFVIVSMTLSGCIFFNKERRITGPSWSVPVTVPLSARQEVSMGNLFSQLLGLEADEDGTFGVSAEPDPIMIPVPDFGDLSEPWDDWEEPDPGQFELKIREEIHLAELVDLGGDLDDSGVVVSKLVLTLNIFNEPGLIGKLKLTMTPVYSGGGSGSAASEIVHLYGGAHPAPVSFEVGLSDKPESLELSGTLTVTTDQGVPQQGELAIEPHVWLPIGFEIDSDGLGMDWNDPEPIPLSEEDRDMLRNVPISDVELVFDLESSSQIGFEIALRFFDGVHDSSPVTVRWKVPPRAEDFKQTVAINEEVRKKLVAPDPHLATKVDFFGTGDGKSVAISEDDVFSYKLYAMITVDVNKQEDN